MRSCSIGPRRTSFDRGLLGIQGPFCSSRWSPTELCTAREGDGTPLCRLPEHSSHL